MSRVEQLTLYKEKGTEGNQLNEATLIKDQGMLGDCHAIGGERQLTLISKKAKDWIKSSEIKGLCFSKFHENIVIDEISLDALPSTVRLMMGAAVLELSSVRKKCYPESCKLAQNDEACLLMKEVRFAKVINGGEIAVGMEVIVIKD